MVILAIGVKPDVFPGGRRPGDWSAKGIKVNPYLQTSDPDIYAVGDAIEVKDL